MTDTSERAHIPGRDASLAPTEPHRLGPPPETRANEVNYAPDLWGTIRRRLRTGEGGGLLRGAGVAFLVQGLGGGVTFAMQVLLGRWMGVRGYGTYSFTVAWAALVAVFAGIGVPLTVLRFIPAFLSQGDYGRVRGILTVSVLVTCAAAFGIALIGSIAALIVGTSSGPDWVLIAGLWITALLTLQELGLEIVRGFRLIALAYAPGMLLTPLLIILGGVAYVASGHHLDSAAALAITAAATAIALLVQGGRFWAKVGSTVRRAAPVYETRAWMAVALPLLLVLGFQVVLSQTDIVMVGAFVGPKAAGTYTAASKISTLVAIILVSANAIAAPMYSSLWAEGKLKDLAVLTHRVAVWVFWPSLFASLVLAVAAKPILGLFGAGFSQAHWILTVLLVGQMIDASMGSVGYLTTLTGGQREAAHVYGAVALLHLAANAVTIPLFGAIGAALATSFSLSVWNLWLHTLVVRRMGIHPSILARSEGRHA
jgi:O-antigen/teichoic acid export membrane protein